MASKQTT